MKRVHIRFLASPVMLNSAFCVFEGTYHATQMVKQTRSFDESERVTVTSKAAKTWESPKKRPMPRSCRVREMTCENIETLGEMLM